jgi:hypothetical protein
MKTLRLLNPRRIAQAIRDLRQIRSGGGPKRLRLVKVGKPQGLLIPTSEVVLEIQARNGSVSEFRPVLPVPFPYAWAYRIAFALGVPLVRSFDPEKIGFELPVPRFGR